MTNRQRVKSKSDHATLVKTIQRLTFLSLCVKVKVHDPTRHCIIHTLPSPPPPSFLSVPLFLVQLAEQPVSPTYNVHFHLRASEPVVSLWMLFLKISTWFASSPSAGLTQKSSSQRALSWPLYLKCHTWSPCFISSFLFFLHSIYSSLTQYILYLFIRLTVFY